MGFAIGTWRSEVLRFTQGEVKQTHIRPQALHCEANSRPTRAASLIHATDLLRLKKRHICPVDKCDVFRGGPDRIRTDDPYNANVMRSQLRYRPIDMGNGVAYMIIIPWA